MVELTIITYNTPTLLLVIKQERLHKDAMWKATKRLQESPQERKERLIIIIIIIINIIIITTVEPQFNLSIMVTLGGWDQQKY